MANILNQMKKKGQVELIMGVLLLGVILVSGTIGAIRSINDARYVVDISNNNTVYDLANCNVESISKEKIKPLSDFNEVERKDFTMAECSK